MQKLTVVAAAVAAGVISFAFNLANGAPLSLRADNGLAVAPTTTKAAPGGKAPGAPQILPVLTKATKEEVKRAEKTYDVVLNAPSKNRVFVDGVDEAMDVHAFEMAEAARAAKRSTRQ